MCVLPLMAALARGLLGALTPRETRRHLVQSRCPSELKRCNSLVRMRKVHFRVYAQLIRMCCVWLRRNQHCPCVGRLEYWIHGGVTRKMKRSSWILACRLQQSYFGISDDRALCVPHEVLPKIRTLSRSLLAARRCPGPICTRMWPSPAELTTQNCSGCVRSVCWSWLIFGML